MIQTVTVRAHRPWKHCDIALFHSEALRLEIKDRLVGEEIIFTVGEDSGAEPVIEVIGGDLIMLDAETLEVIPEGATYCYNIWSRVEEDVTLIQRGKILIRASIAPTLDIISVDPLVITAGPIPQAVEGDPFSYATVVSGGVPPFDYDLAAGQLPVGLSFSASTGVLSGTPTTSGTFNGIVLRVTDDMGTVALLPAFGLVVEEAVVVPQHLTVSADAPLLLIDGDSILDYNATRMVLEHYVGHQFRKVVGYNLARAGDSTQQILGGVQDVIDKIEPGKTVVLVGPTGANQGIGSSTFAEISAQQQQIYDAYLAAGAIVVAVPTLPETDVFGPPTKNDALLEWVYAQQTGGTVSYDGSVYPVEARVDFYAVDIGLPDRGETGSNAYAAGAFNPYTMKNDQTHPNGTGARYLANRITDVLDGLVSSDIFSEVATNLAGTAATFGGSVAASRPGITGEVPADWVVSRSGSETTWVCSKDTSDNLVASVTDAGNNSVLSLEIDLPVNGSLGDIFDMVVEVEVSGADNGFKGLRIIAATGSDTPGDADFYPDRSMLAIRSISAPLTQAQATQLFTIQSMVEPGASVTLTFKRTAVFYAGAQAGLLSITGTPAVIGEVGTPYSFMPTVDGGSAPYSFDLATGSLPAGLNLNAQTGAITGTPTTAETTSGIAVRVTDAVGATRSLAAFSLEITTAAVPQNMVIPALSTASPTEGQEVIVNQGSWTNSPTTYQYRWRHSGNIQATEVASAHTPQVGSAPQTLSAEVRAQNAGGWSAWASTLESDPIEVAQVATPVPWDPNIFNPLDLVFSDGDRTLTNTSSNGNRHMRGTQPISGKIYFEIEATNEVRGVGIADEALTGTQTKTLGVNCVYWTGVAVLNGTSNNVGGSYVNGDIIQVAVDRDADLIWVRKNDTGDWNGNAGADPALGTGGIDISGMTSSTVFAMVSLRPGGITTLNGSANRLDYTIPAGFGTLP